MHKLSSRFGAGSKISVLEVIAPRAVTEGVEYYLNSEGNMFAESEMLPVVMLPRVGATFWQNMPQSSSNPTIHQYGATTAPGAPTNQLHTRMPLTAPYAMYLHYATYASNTVMRAVVMNEESGERVAEATFNGYTDTATYLDTPIGYTYTATDKVGVLCRHTTSTGTDYSMRVVEFTFVVGTLALTASAKTPVGSAVAGGHTFVAAGAGVSLGKIAVASGANRFVVNLVANTVNSASGFTNANCQVEDNRLVTLGVTNAVTIADLETNGSSSFTATGATWTGTPSQVVRLHPRVYLIIAGFAASNVNRLLVINAGFTAGVVSVVNNPALIEFDFAPIVIQQRTGSPVFYLVEQAANGKAVAASIAVASDGTILQHIKPLTLTENVLTFSRNLLPTNSGARPYVLDVPVVTEISRVQSASPFTADTYAVWFVKFRADVTLGLYNPVYFGRALATVAQGAPATFAGSPELLAVDPVQTAFQRVGRVIKVNELQGFFLLAANYKFGADVTSKMGGDNSFTFGIDESSLNYPIVFGQLQPAAGSVTFSFPYNAGSPSYTVVMVTPMGVVRVQVGTSSGSNNITDVKLQFSGFAVVAARIDINVATHRTIGLTYDVEALDYV